MANQQFQHPQMAMQHGSAGRLYLVTAVVQPTANGVELMKTIMKIHNNLGDYSSWTKVLYSFKITGEPHVFAIIEVYNVIGLERQMAGLSLVGNVKVTCEPIIPYEKFAENFGIHNYHQVPFNIGDGNDIYMLEFNVDKYDMSTDDLIAIWSKEAEFILGKRNQGFNIVLYKIIGQRKVLAVVKDDPANVDFTSFSIPLMKQAGGFVQMKCRNIQALASYTKNIVS